jgi:hypothetical protein
MAVTWLTMAKLHAGGNCSIIAGDAEGSVTCLLPYQAKWRMKMSEILLMSDMGVVCGRCMLGKR